MANQKPGNRAKDQVKGFKAAARELDCDESEAAFDRALGKIGKAKVADPEAKKRRAKRF